MVVSQLLESECGCVVVSQLFRVSVSVVVSQLFRVSVSVVVSQLFRVSVIVVVSIQLLGNINLVGDLYSLDPERARNLMMIKE